MAKVSAVVPVFGTEKFLEQCLDSIAFQTHPDVEIVVVNDASPGNCREMMEKYRRRCRREIVYLEHDKNRGTLRTVLTGLKNASGDYVMVVDSDDWISLEVCERVLAGIRPDDDIVMFDMRRVMTRSPDKNSPSMLQGLKKEYLGSAAIIEAMLQPIQWHMCGKLMRMEPIRRALNKYPLDDVYLTRSDDLLRSITLATEAERMSVHPEAGVYYYFARSDSVTASLYTSFLNFETCLKHHLITYDTLRRILAERFPDSSLIAALDRTFVLLNDDVGSVLHHVRPEMRRLYAQTLLENTPSSHLLDLAAAWPESALGTVFAHLANKRKKTRSGAIRRVAVFCEEKTVADDVPECSKLLRALKGAGMEVVLFSAKKTNPESGVEKVTLPRERAERMRTIARECARRDIDASLFLDGFSSRTLYDLVAVFASDMFLLVCVGKDFFAPLFSNAPAGMWSINSALRQVHAVVCSTEDHMLYQRAMGVATAVFNPELVQASDDDQAFSRAWAGLFDAVVKSEMSGYGIACSPDGQRFRALLENCCDRIFLFSHLRREIEKQRLLNPFHKIADRWLSKSSMSRRIGERLLGGVAKSDENAYWRSAPAAQPTGGHPGKTAVSHIGMFTSRMCQGGRERVLSILVPLFIAQGRRVTIFTDQPKSPDDYPLPDSVERVVLPESVELRRTIITQYCAGEGVDLCMLIDHDTHTETDAAAAREVGALTIFCLHAEFFYPVTANEFPPVIRFLDIELACDASISLSEMDLFRMRASGVTASAMIHNPLLFDPAACRRADGTSKNVLFVARLVPEKGVYLLPHIIKHIAEGNSEATVVLAGEFYHKDWEEAFWRDIEAWGLEDRVRHLGFVGDIGPCFQNAAVFILPSHMEGMPNVLYEAKAHGVPTVMFDIRTLENTGLENGCITVEKFDVRAMASEVCRLLNDREYWQEMSARARASLDRLLAEDIGGEWEKLFQAVLDGDVENRFRPVREIEAADFSKILLEFVDATRFLSPKQLYRYERLKAVDTFLARCFPPETRRRSAWLASIRGVRGISHGYLKISRRIRGK